MNDAEALLASILATPDDDTPRLVFADWLDENGQSARAEFIRVQIELAQISNNEHRGTSPEDPHYEWKTQEFARVMQIASRSGNKKMFTLIAREKTLLTTHGENWLAPLREKGEPLEANGTHGQFRRGFVEVVWMSAPRFLRHAGRLFRMTPVRELRVTRATHNELGELVASALMTNLETLDLSDFTLGPIIRLVFSASQHVHHLKILRLRNCGITDHGAFQLANCSQGWPLRELDVSFNPIGRDGILALQKRFGIAVRTTLES